MGFKGMIDRTGRQGMVLRVGLGLAIFGARSFGQTQATPIAPSDLARQNLAHVAASVGQIVGILHRDPGLMVELKRWIAKDATDHGQLISDADLADEAIFERLETDVTFRSVATQLVQKYGYLKPTVNPESQEGREQELLMQERVRFLAQQGGGPSRTTPGQASKQTQACDPLGGNCATNPSLPQPSQQPGIQTPTQMPGLQSPQNAPGTPYLPPQQTPPTNSVTDLRMGGQDTFGMDQGSANNSFGGTSDLSSSGESGLFSTASQRETQNPLQSQSGSSGANHNEDASLSSEFGGDPSNRNLYATSLPNNAPYGTNPFAAGSFDADSGAPRNDLTGNSSPAIENSLRLRESSSTNARLVRRPNPYNYIPSLYDMYLQATPHPAALERFGMQVFQNGTRDLQSIPMDLPVGPDYVLGPGDAVAIDLWGGVSRRFYEVVDREGRISLPEIGPELVAGKSLADVQQSVQKTLRTQFRDVSADVSLARLRTIRVYVVGDVVRPGAYDIGSLSTPLNALFSAGGPTPRGSLRIVKHFRGNQLVQDVDVYDLLLHGVKGDIERLENGDTVMVPPLGPEITIEGMVRRPAIYEQKDEKSLR